MLAEDMDNDAMDERIADYEQGHDDSETTSQNSLKNSDTADEPSEQSEVDPNTADESTDTKPEENAVPKNTSENLKLSDLPTSPALPRQSGNEDELAKLYDAIQQLHASLDRYTQKLEQVEEYKENISTQFSLLNEKITDFTKDISALKSNEYMEKISMAYHHMENTNKKYAEMTQAMNANYTDMMKSMPAEMEKSYADIVSKHAKQYQKLLKNVSSVMERELLPNNNTKTYYALIVITIIQTIFLLILLRY